MSVIWRFLAVTLLALALPAQGIASGPAAGGRYRDSRPYGAQCRSCRVDVSLLAADDQRSLLTPSTIDFTEICRRGPKGSRKSLADYTIEAPAGVAVDSDGRFHWVEDQGGTSFIRVSGRFASGGGSVHGRIIYRSFDDTGGTAACRRESVAFRASLRGVPYEPRPGQIMRCPEVQVQDAWNIDIEPVHRGSGCTAATQVALQWRTTRACRTSPTQLQACSVAGHSCEPTTTGQLDDLSAVACTSPLSPDGVVELIVRWECNNRSSQDDVYASAVNVSCVQAERVKDAWEAKPACSNTENVGDTCSPVPDWDCTTTIADVGSAGTIAAQCRSRSVPRNAVEVLWALPA